MGQLKIMGQSQLRCKKRLKRDENKKKSSRFNVRVDYEGTNYMFNSGFTKFNIS